MIGATNRLDTLDPALRRPGRFDRELKFNLPDVSARLQILEIHTQVCMSRNKLIFTYLLCFAVLGRLQASLGGSRVACWID